MLSTLKTYANKDTNVSFILSYAMDGKGATFSLFKGGQSVTVELTPADVKALNAAVHEAYYAYPDHF
ncbi:hypothetical protein [Streptomyces werraensis]|uniref:hypothetical protein n=1 Tax=Streptomyces werraensis TaxID=68284 RepID=UPI0036F720B1